MSVSKQLRELRTTRGLTQKELAQGTDIPLQSIINYENGRREPNSKAMAALERFFGVSGEYLRGEVDRDTFKQKSFELDGNMETLIELFKSFQLEFRISDQDVQLESVAVLEAALHYLNSQLAQRPPSMENLKAYSNMLKSYLKVPADDTPEDELIKKYRQLDERGQAAVTDTLRREYDFLNKVI